MKKIILLITVLGMTNVSSIMNASNITGIKPFAVYLEHYHIINKNGVSHDTSIGKRIKIINFDGEKFTFCKMGLIRINGNDLVYGPILDSKGDPIDNKYTDTDFFTSMHDLMYNRYKYTFEGSVSTIFSFYSNKIQAPTNHNIAFDRKTGKIMTNMATSNPNKSVFATIGLFDENKQYQYFEVNDNRELVLKKKVAVNPDKYDITLPFLDIQLKMFPRSEKYYLLTKDDRKVVIGGKDVYYRIPLMQSRNNTYYVSIYEFAKFFGYGILHNQNEKYWKVVKLHNPNLYELSYIELIIHDDNKTIVTYKGEQRKLEYNWFYPDKLSCPYISLREFSEMFGFKYSYRDIDKTVLIP